MSGDLDIFLLWIANKHKTSMRQKKWRKMCNRKIWEPESLRHKAIYRQLGVLLMKSILYDRETLKCQCYHSSNWHGKSLLLSCNNWRNNCVVKWKISCYRLCGLNCIHQHQSEKKDVLSTWDGMIYWRSLNVSYLLVIMMLEGKFLGTSWVSRAHKKSERSKVAFTFATQ